MVKQVVLDDQVVVAVQYKGVGIYVVICALTPTLSQREREIIDFVRLVQRDKETAAFALPAQRDKGTAAFAPLSLWERGWGEGLLC